LILLGVSSGVYAALKTTENKQITVTPPVTVTPVNAATTTITDNSANNIQPNTAQ